MLLCSLSSEELSDHLLWIAVIPRRVLESAPGGLARFQHPVAFGGSSSKVFWLKLEVRKTFPSLPFDGLLPFAACARLQEYLVSAFASPVGPKSEASHFSRPPAASGRVARTSPAPSRRDEVEAQIPAAEWPCPPATPLLAATHSSRRRQLNSWKLCAGWRLAQGIAAFRANHREVQSMRDCRGWGPTGEKVTHCANGHPLP